MKFKIIIMSFTLLTVLTALAGLFIYYNSMKAATLKEDRIISEAHADNIQNSISQLLAHYQSVALALSMHKEMALCITDHSETNLIRVNEILDLFNFSLETSVCYLLNMDGVVIASSNRKDSDSFMGNDYSFRPYFIESIKGNPFVYMAYGVTSGRRGIYFATPVYSPDSGAIVGVSVIKEEIDRIEHDLLSMHYPTHGEHNDIVFITNGDGVIFISDREDLLFHTLWQTNEDAIKNIASSRQFGEGPWPFAGFEKTAREKVFHQSGSNYDFLSKPIKEIPGWKVVHLSDSDAVLGRLHGAFIKTAGYIGPFIAAIIGFVLFILNFLATKVEKDLRKSEERYRSVTETVNEGIILQAASGEILTWNKGAEIIVGIPAKDVIGKIFHSKEWPVIHEDGSRCEGGEHPLIQSIFDGKPNRNKIMGVLRPKGEVRWISVNTNPLFQENKEKEFAVVISFSDITDRKQAEENYRMLFREMLDGFALHEIILDSAGKPVNYRFLAVNPAFERLTGLESHFLIGKTVLEVLPKTECHWIEKYGQVALTGKPAFFEDFSQDLDRHFQVTAFRPAKNQFACIITDITHRKKMEARLLQAQKMESIGSLAGGIAHDFNNILFPIVGMAELLLEDLPLESLEHENVQEILKAGKRAGDLVNQILAFSRQSDHKLMPVRVQQILKEVLKLSRSAIPSDIEITMDIQSDCGLIMANATQVHQIAMNLITNAFHAVEPRGGKISVKLREIELGCDDLTDSSLKPGRYVMLTISDTGCGIKPEISDRIFEPYFTTKEQGKGTGLGLSIVYGIIKEYRGDIKVYSEVGKGTTFNVYLPLMERSLDTAPIPLAEIHETGTEHILLIDDEEPIAQLEKQMLQRLGYNVTVRTSSIEGLEAFKANPGGFDLILTDMTMPNMTGNQLARELISVKPGIPIIICTGFSERMNREKIEACGIKGFLMKPVLKAEMAHLVRKVIDESKS